MSWSLPTRARHPLCESEERCGLKVEILDSLVAHALALAHTDSRGLKKVFSRNVWSSGKILPKKIRICSHRFVGARPHLQTYAWGEPLWWRLLLKTRILGATKYSPSHAFQASTHLQLSVCTLFFTFHSHSQPQLPLTMGM